MAAPGPVAVFGDGSLVARPSAEATLGRPVPELHPARLEGWRRRFSLARDNVRAEKTFADPEGLIPPSVLSLNVERRADPEEAPNGALIEVDERDLVALDARELRYDRVDVTAAIRGPAAGRFASVITYVAKPERFAPEPPAGAVILRSYASAVEAAFDGISPAEGELYRRTTLPYPAPLIEGALVADRIPPGNPRAW